MNKRMRLLLLHPSPCGPHPSLSRLRDLAALDADGADLHADVAALRALDADGLQIGVKAAAGAVVRV